MALECSASRFSSADEAVLRGRCSATQTDLQYTARYCSDFKKRCFCFESVCLSYPQREERTHQQLYWTLMIEPLSLWPHWSG